MPFEGVNYYQTSGNLTATLNCSSYSHFQNDNYPNLLKQKKFYDSLSNGYNPNFYTDFDNSNKTSAPSSSITSPISHNLQSTKNSNPSANFNVPSTINNINVNHTSLNSSASSRLNANHNLHDSLSSDSLTSISSNSVKTTNGILLDKDIELKIINELKSLNRPTNSNKDQRTNLMQHQQQPNKKYKQIKDQDSNNQRIELAKSPIMTNCKDLNNNTINNVDCLSSSSNASLQSSPANPNNALTNNFLNNLNKNFNNGLNCNLNSNDLNKLRKSLQGDFTGDLISNLTNCDLTGIATTKNSINLAKNPISNSYNDLNALNGLNNYNGINSNALSASLNYLSNLDVSSTLSKQFMSGSFDNLLANQLDTNLNQMRLNQQSNTRQINQNILNGLDNYMNPLNKHLSNKKMDPNKFKKQLPLNKSLNQEMNSSTNVLDTTMNNLFCEPIKKICRVCGDKASYNNYFVLTCDACKTFFR